MVSVIAGAARAVHGSVTSDLSFPEAKNVIALAVAAGVLMEHLLIPCGGKNTGQLQLNAAHAERIWSRMVKIGSEKIE